MQLDTLERSESGDAVPYDDLAEIYDHWIASGGDLLKRNQQFYVDQYLSTDGPIVELGVGNGRILVEAALAGKNVIGIDSSVKMCELCQRKVDDASVSDRVKLLLGDFRSFELRQPASLISIPYDSIGHLAKILEIRRCLEHVFHQLRPRGHFIFDQLAPSRQKDNKPFLRAAFDNGSGQKTLLWCKVMPASHAYYEAQVWTETLGIRGLTTRRDVGKVRNMWLNPGQWHRLLEETGFIIETSMSDYDGTPLTQSCVCQIWIVRRP
jgi:ubiquinone/menaquinone biosynthesis C-methylase UbiE